MKDTFPGFAELVSSHWGGKWWQNDFPLLLWDTPQEFVCDSWIIEECAPLIPFYRLIDRSGFGDAFGSVKTTASDDVQEKTFLGGCLMWHYAAVWTLSIVFI